MKKFIAILLSCCILLTGCNAQNSLSQSNDTTTTVYVPEQTSAEVSTDISTEESVNTTTEKSEETTAAPTFSGLEDPELQQYIEDEVYTQLVNELDSENYFIDEVRAQFLSKEYLEELEYNSKENVFFGYSLSELIDSLGNTKYVFSLGDDGETIIKPFEEYDDTYEKAIKNVIIGTGLIIICVTVAIITDGVGAPAAVTAIFTASAKAGTVSAFSGALISGVTECVVTSVKTDDFEEIQKSTLLAASEGYKWGAIFGVITGGVNEAVSLHQAASGGITMNEAALIQKETKWSAEIIKKIHSIDEYNIYKAAGLTGREINGKLALIRKIDLNETNLDRIKKGFSPLDPNGKAYEIHHVGQDGDSPLFAILTQAEHRQNGNYKILHPEEVSNVDHGREWQKQVREFWKAYAEIFG